MSIIEGQVTRIAPSVLFGLFSKVIANLVMYMYVSAPSSMHATCAGSLSLHAFESYRPLRPFKIVHLK